MAERTSAAAGRPGPSVIRSACRGALAMTVLGAAAVLLPVTTAIPGHGRTRRGALVAQVISRLLLRVLRVDVQRRGAPAPGPCLVVANHVSWLDVLVLAGAAPMIPVARAEVAHWPVIGALTARWGAVFVRPDRPRELPAAVAEMTAILRRGHRVQVFPESSAGGRTPPWRFHRAAFQAAVDAAVVIAPVALVYRTTTGAPTSAVACLGDDVPGSLWRILRSGPITVQVRWLPVIPAVVGAEHPAASRALAARRAERAVAVALGVPVAGRPGRIPARIDRSAPALQVA